MITTDRITKLHELVFSRHKNLDGILISKRENVAYLTGFRGSFGQLFLTPHKALLVSDTRYSEKAKKLFQNTIIEYIELERSENFWQKVAHKLQIKTLGFEAHEVSVAALQKLKNNFGSAVVLKKTENLVETIRLQKSSEEIENLQKAASIGDHALAVAIKHLKAGVTEKEIAWIFEVAARQQFGVEGLSFDTIVAFGANSAIPHHETSNTKLTKNTPVLIDCGVKYHDYCSDMTRCFFYGTPTPKWLKTFKLVHKAQQEGIKRICPGEKIAEPDLKTREIFGKEQKYFGHSFGHGVGLEIHESPSLSQYASGKFTENMVVTAEPGLYYPEEFGIRIEDLLLIGKTTNIILSQFPQIPYVLTV